MKEPVFIKSKSGEVMATAIPPGYDDALGVFFFTDPDCSQQLGYSRHNAGKVIEPHTHQLIVRQVVFTQEILWVNRGRLRVDFYDREQQFIQSLEMGPGWVLHLMKGGHGFEVLEDVEFFEVKQGPYAGKDDKIIFKPQEQADGSLPRT